MNDLDPTHMHKNQMSKFAPTPNRSLAFACTPILEYLVLCMCMMWEFEKDQTVQTFKKYEKDCRAALAASQFKGHLQEVLDDENLHEHAGAEHCTDIESKSDAPKEPKSAHTLFHTKGLTQKQEEPKVKILTVKGVEPKSTSKNADKLCFSLGLPLTHHLQSFKAP